MASFTDPIPQFKEYVPQLPVEAMVKAGLYKQQRYEENVQKIQSQIDNIAGLDVLRDVDKNYLQSKLNELGNRLTSVAAGDFSNFQLVNSVSGMTSQIVKDKNVQNAVSSTARYRKGLSQIEEARKQGKSSASNEYIFNRSAQKWINSTNLEESFSGSFKPYTNYKKNALDVIKSLTKDETITDDAFTVDASGNLVISDAIVRKKLSGISPEKIQTALMAGLTPDDFEQMQIDGIYTYANYDDANFGKSITKSYDDKLLFYNDQIKTLESAKSSTNSAIERAKLDEKIESINSTIKKIKNNYEDVMSSYNSGNFDGAKAKLYTNDFINNFSKSFSNTEISMTYVDSPLADMKMRREIKEQDWKKFTIEYEQKERFHKEDIDQKKEENRLKKLELEGYGGLPAPVDQSVLPKYTFDKLLSEVTNNQNTINTLEGEFLKQQGKDKDWLDKQQLAWEKSPNSVDPVVANYFNSVSDMQRKVNADQQMILDIRKQAESKFGKIEDLIPKNSPNIILTTEGKRYTLTPKDFVSLQSSLGKYVQSKGGGVGINPYTLGTTSGTISYDDATAKKELSPEQYKIYEIYKKKYTGKPLSPGENTIIDNFEFYRKNVIVPYGNITKKIDAFTNEEVTKRVTQMQGVSYGIPTTSPAQKASISTVLNQFADLADKQGGKLALSPNFSSEKARKIAADENARYSMTVVEGTEKQPRMYRVSASSKGENIEFNVTPEQKDAVFGRMFEPSPEVKAVRPYIEQMRKMGGYSTATTPGESTYSNSFMNKIDFPNVSIYGVKANLVSPDGLNSFSIRLSIYDPIQKKWHDDLPYPTSQLMKDNEIAKAMIGLNDAAIYEMLYGKAPSKKDIELVKNASKNPL